MPKLARRTFNKLSCQYTEMKCILAYLHYTHFDSYDDIAVAYTKMQTKCMTGESDASCIVLRQHYILVKRGRLHFLIVWFRRKLKKRGSSVQRTWLMDNRTTWSKFNESMTQYTSTLHELPWSSMNHLLHTKGFDLSKHDSNWSKLQDRAIAKAKLAVVDAKSRIVAILDLQIHVLICIDLCNFDDFFKMIFVGRCLMFLRGWCQWRGRGTSCGRCL